MVDRWTGTFGLESLESAIAILFLGRKRERRLILANSIERPGDHSLSATDCSQRRNKLGKKWHQEVVRRSRSGAVVEEDSGELLPGEGGRENQAVFCQSEQLFFILTHSLDCLLAFLHAFG